MSEFILFMQTALVHKLLYKSIILSQVNDYMDYLCMCIYTQIHHIIIHTKVLLIILFKLCKFKYVATACVLYYNYLQFHIFAPVIEIK